MKRRFGEDRVTSQQRVSHPIRDIERPGVMLIVSIAKCHQKTAVGDRIHFLEKPLRFERSFGPAMTPANRRNGRVSDFLAFSSSSRMMRPRGRPVLRAVCSNHSARSPGSRTVIVLLICLKCNTLPSGTAESALRPGMASLTGRAHLVRLVATDAARHAGDAGVLRHRVHPCHLAVAHHALHAGR